MGVSKFVGFSAEKPPESANLCKNQVKKPKIGSTSGFFSEKSAESPGKEQKNRRVARQALENHLVEAFFQPIYPQLEKVINGNIEIVQE